MKPFVKENLKNHFDVRNLTNLQQQVIDALEEYNHIAVSTTVDNGKTLSYLVPGLHIVMRAMQEEENRKLPGFRLLILTNTRERTMIIMNQLQKLLGQQADKIKSIALAGGQSLENEINYLDRVQPEIIVSTLGRISRHMKNSNYFDNVKLVVVDNANTLNRYADVIKTIFEQLPKERKTLAISVGADIVKDNSPLVPIIFPDSQPQHQITTSGRELAALDSLKFSNVKCRDATDFAAKLIAYLSENRSKKVAVRVYSVAMAEFLTNLLAKNEIYAYTVHHNQAPTFRRSIVNEFNKIPNGIVIGTEIIEHALNNTLDAIVTAEGEYENIEFLISHLKRNSKYGAELISFSLPPFGKGLKKEVSEKDIKPAANISLPDRKYVESLFFSQLLTLSNQSEDKNAMLDAASQFAQQMGLEALPKMRYDAAKRSRIDGILKEKNLLVGL
jgi:superfamily II DNA/RNA helicase